MAQVQVVAAPPIEWLYRVQFPGPTTNAREVTGFESMVDKGRAVQTGGIDGGARATGTGRDQSGATSGDRYAIIDGVPCMHTSTAPRDWGWSFPWWTPRLDASAVPSGVRTPEGALYAVLDAFVWWGYASGGTNSDQRGVWISGGLGPSGGRYYAQTPGGGGTPQLGGAGFLIQNAGGYDFVTWNRTALAVTHRIAGVVPSQDEWNWFRFVIRSAEPGGFAQYQAYANGVLVFEEDYGAATLPIPYDVNTATTTDKGVAPTLAFCGPQLTPPAGFAYAFEAKFGRFTLDGVPVQAE